jgi:hypothetical protein
MKTIVGKWQARSITKVFPAKWAWAVEALLLFALGGLAMVLHAKMRIPIRVPGHHGLEFMALIIAGRSISRIPFGASISGLGVAAFCLLPFLGFRDPFMPIVFFIPTLLVDIGFRAMPGFQKKVWYLVIIAALAHASIPLTRTIISLLTGYQYGSLLGGLLYPLSSYLNFGLLGGLLGAGVVHVFRKK